MADLSLMQQECEKLKGNLENINQSIKKLNWNRNPQNILINQGREIERNLNKPNGLVVHIQNNIYQDSIHIKNFPDQSIVDHEYNDQISINNDESLSEGEIDESEPKPKLSSSVTQIINPVKSREEVMGAQVDNKLNARNKRMFGHLLGTLNQFKKESDEAKEKIKFNQRKEIEKKVDEKAVQERQDIIAEKRKLFREQIDAKNRIKALEIKIEILRLEEAWEEYQNQMKKFIKTKVHPCIFYLPSTVTPDLQIKLEQSINLIEQAIMERRILIEGELKKLDDPDFFTKIGQKPFPKSRALNGLPNPKPADENVAPNDTGNRGKFISEKDLQPSQGDEVKPGARWNQREYAREERRANLNYVIFQFRRVIEQKIKAAESEKIRDPDGKESQQHHRGDGSRRSSGSKRLRSTVTKPSSPSRDRKRVRGSGGSASRDPQRNGDDISNTHSKKTDTSHTENSSSTKDNGVEQTGINGTQMPEGSSFSLNNQTTSMTNTEGVSFLTDLPEEEICHIRFNVQDETMEQNFNETDQNAPEDDSLIVMEESGIQTQTIVSLKPLPLGLVESGVSNDDSMAVQVDDGDVANPQDLISIAGDE